VSSEFRWEGNLEARLNQFGPRVKRAMVASAKYSAQEAESFMRSEAPWTDRTGAARMGLNADVQVATNKVAIVLYHSVPYGPFLEVRWGGKYGIIKDTMAAIGPRWVSLLGKMVFDA
jgi:hypothetical protein